MKLIVIDMQKALMDDELYHLESLKENVRRIIETARENGIEVIYVQHDAGPGTGFSAGDEAFEIADEVAPRSGEKVFVKKINSCFGCGDFTAYLEEAKDDTLMIVGLQTNFCIDATVKSAFERGYHVIVPEGTNSTFDNPYMTGETTCAYYFNEVWPELFAECVSLDEAVALMNGKPLSDPDE
ncbi:MAG: cysteine hydrolase [Oscillospiraceae bacterium]|nr:cysteine hydrolase [Oscillospiraceae bacterium]